SGGVGGTRRGVKCLHAHLAWWLAGGDDPVGRWVAQRIALDVSQYPRSSQGSQSSVSRIDAGGAVAAIDCGTNSTRLLVVGADGDVLDRLMRITRLGEDVDATRRLAPRAISRTIDVLREYRSVMDARHVVAARLVATSATRDAENSGEFFAAAEAVTGNRPELLSGDEEGRLSFSGATANLPLRWRERAEAEGPVLVVDIGGGSTELVVGNPVAHVAGAGDDDDDDGDAADDVVSLSLDIGCVRVSERFFHHDPPSAAELAKARAFVESTLVTARGQLPELTEGEFVIGLAGTVSTVAALESQLAHYEREAIHHAVLNRAQVRRWLDTLAGEDKAARLDRPGMVGGREDVIVGGVMVLDLVMEVFARAQCLVSEDDILDGLAASVRSGSSAKSPWGLVGGGGHGRSVRAPERRDH
ncbi:MAG: DUF501 domain-containing protein, partial [Acidimicrobiales bacterium]